MSQSTRTFRSVLCGLCFVVLKFTKVGEVTWSEWSFGELLLEVVWKCFGRESEAGRPIRKLLS